MSKYKGLFTFDVDNHRYVSFEQADGPISDMNYNPEPKKESKEIWWLDNEGNVNRCKDIDEYCFARNKEIGNYFETREEAEKAVEKLKAWKRLKDNGFEFTGWDRHPDFPGDFRITASDEWTCDDKDLDLLFGGEE